MKKQIKVSFLFTLVSTVGLGIIYPMALTGLSFLVPALSPPSLLIQTPQGDRVFQGRPSMSGGPYSGASNLSLTNQHLRHQVEGRLKRLTKGYPAGTSTPPDLLFASASGYDADISPQAALFQVPRIARVRGVDALTLQKLVKLHTRPKLWGFIGTEKVNVIGLNKSLEKLAVKVKSPAGRGIFHIER